MKSIPIQEFQERISRLQSAMADNGFDCALIVQRADLYYFTGTGQDAHVFVPVEGTPQLFVRRNFERAVEESPWEKILPIKNLKEVKKHMKSVLSSASACIGMELDILPVNIFRSYEELFPKSVIKDISPLIREVRMIKSDYEIDCMVRSAQLNDSMFAQVHDILREGMTEVELAAHIEAYYRKRGHQGFIRLRSFNQEVFYGHIMSGPNLAIPSCSVGPTGGPGLHPSLPQGVGRRKIGRNEPVQVDYVAIVDGYLVDQARTFFLGEPPAKFRKVHSLALKIQNTIANEGAPGTPAERLYEIALELARSAGFSKGFLGYPQPVPFVGHGIGLELDELPVIGRKSPHVMQENITIALEPKFIFPGEGLAGIENTFVVRKNGFEKLTKFDDEIQVIN